MFTKYSSYEHYSSKQPDQRDLFVSDNRSDQEVLFDIVIEKIDQVIEVLFKKYEKIKAIKMHLDRGASALTGAARWQLNIAPICKSVDCSEGGHQIHSITVRS